MTENNVLYVGGFYLPNGNAAAQRVVANAKLLMDLGYSVTLIGLTTDNTNINQKFDFDGLTCVNLPYPKSFIQWLKYLSSIRPYILYLKELAPKIVIAYNHPAIALNHLLKYCRQRGIKIVSDCTEWYVPQGGWLFRKIKRWDINKRMYEVHCRMDGIIAISKYLYDFYIERGVHTLQLPPLVDKQETKWNSPLSATDKTIRFIFAGSIGRGYKDRVDCVIETLIEVGKGKRIALDVIGITERQFRSVYEGWGIKELPDFIHFHGRMPHNEVIALLRQSDFQIFLRENNLVNTAGFPTKFVETISAGTLVLTNASSNVKDYMQEGLNSFELDIKSKAALHNSLITPLSLSKEEILEKKRHIDNSMFDYRRFTQQMYDFINTM